MKLSQKEIDILLDMRESVVYDFQDTYNIVFSSHSLAFHSDFELKCLKKDLKYNLSENYNASSSPIFSVLVENELEYRKTIK